MLPQKSEPIDEAGFQELFSWILEEADAKNPNVKVKTTSHQGKNFSYIGLLREYLIILPATKEEYLVTTIGVNFRRGIVVSSSIGLLYLLLKKGKSGWVDVELQMITEVVDKILELPKTKPRRKKNDGI